MRKFLAMLLAALMLLAVVGCTAPAADGQKDAADDKKTEAPADGKTEDNKTEDNKTEETKKDPAKTGDAGVGLALAGLTIAGAAAFVTKKRS